MQKLQTRLGQCHKYKIPVLEIQALRQSGTSISVVVQRVHNLYIICIVPGSIVKCSCFVYITLREHKYIFYLMNPGSCSGDIGSFSLELQAEVN